MLQNHSEDELSISVGDRIGQLVVVPLVDVVAVEDPSLAERVTQRGVCGFGSSGVS